MSQLRRRFTNFFDRHDGPTAVHYAIALSVLVMVGVFAVRTLGMEGKVMPGKAATKTVSAAR
jgi:hypothetical protein